MSVSTAVKIVNDALLASGLEAEFPVNLKSILILIVEAAIRKGYVDGFEDCINKKSSKIKKEDLIDFYKLYKK